MRLPSCMWLDTFSSFEEQPLDSPYQVGSLNGNALLQAAITTEDRDAQLCASSRIQRSP